MEDNMLKHDENKPITQGWHLDKRIGVAHILTTISLLVGLGSIIWALESRVTLVEQRVLTHEATTEVELSAIKERDRQLLNEMNRHYLEIKQSLSRIEGKLERHSENDTQHGKG